MTFYTEKRLQFGLSLVLVFGLVAGIMAGINGGQSWGSGGSRGGHSGGQNGCKGNQDCIKGTYCSQSRYGSPRNCVKCKDDYKPCGSNEECSCQRCSNSLCTPPAPTASPCGLDGASCERNSCCCSNYCDMSPSGSGPWSDSKDPSSSGSKNSGSHEKYGTCIKNCTEFNMPCTTGPKSLPCCNTTTTTNVCNAGTGTCQDICYGLQTVGGACTSSSQCCNATTAGTEICIIPSGSPTGTCSASCNALFSACTFTADCCIPTEPGRTVSCQSGTCTPSCANTGQPCSAQASACCSTTDLCLLPMGTVNSAALLTCDSCFNPAPCDNNHNISCCESICVYANGANTCQVDVYDNYGQYQP